MTRVRALFQNGGETVLRLSDGENVPVSRRRARAVKSRLEAVVSGDGSSF